MSVILDATNFPDQLFRNYLTSHFDLDNDGILSDQEIAAITVININNLSISDSSQTYHVDSLAGIEYLTALKELYCTNVAATSIDLTNNVDLEVIDCSSSRSIQNINLSHNTKLKEINAEFTSITQLDISANTNLEVIRIGGGIDYDEYAALRSVSFGIYPKLRSLELLKLNALSTIDFSNSAYLEDVNIRYCTITACNFSGCSSLIKLDVVNCPNMISLDLSGCTQLKVVGAYLIDEGVIDSTSYIGYANIGYHCASLTSINCDGCTALEVFHYRYQPNSALIASVSLSGCTALKSFRCDRNNLSSLQLQDCAALEYVDCQSNSITDLQIGNAQHLNNLICYDNNISSFVISSAPVISNLLDDTAYEYASKENTRIAYVAYTDDTGSLCIDPGTSITVSGTIYTSPDFSEFQSIEINATNFPDLIFREIIARFDVDGDGILNGEELWMAKGLACTSQNVASFDGIKLLPMLETLRIERDSSLTTLDLSNISSLKSVNIQYTNLAELNLSGCTSLTGIDVRNNKLSSLDVSTCTSLRGLYCLNNAGNNAATSIIFGDNTELERLVCPNSGITSLNLTTLSGLKRLECNENNIQQINISMCPELLSIFSGSTDPLLLDVKHHYEDSVVYYPQNNSAIYIQADYQTEIIGAKAYISLNPSDITCVPGDHAVFNMSASGVNLNYIWQKRNTVSNLEPSVINDGSICDIYSDGKIRINTHEAFSEDYTLMMVLADAQLSRGTYRIKPNATNGSNGVKLYVWSSRMPPVAFGIFTNDPAEDDPCVTASCYTNSMSGCTFTVNNPNHYICVSLDACKNAAITEQELRPTIEKLINGSYVDISHIWTYYPIWENISGATSNAYSITANGNNDNTQYRCKVYNGFSEAYTEPASLNVIIPPSITDNPTSITIREGNNASFSVNATGSDLQYQWQVSTDDGATWTNIECDEDSPWLISFIADYSMNGMLFRCNISNSAGNVTSSEALLSVTIQPRITRQPRSVSIECGDNAVFTVTAEDMEGAGLNYTWQFRADVNSEWANVNGDIYSGASSESLTVTSSTELDGYQYRCYVEGGHDGIYSESAELITFITPPEIIEQPQYVTAETNTVASISVSVSGRGLQYQWQVSTDDGQSWTNIESGGTSSSYSLTAIKEQNEYLYRCFIENGGGSVVSYAVSVFALDPPVITEQPQNCITADARLANFYVETTGDDLVYRWQVKISEDGAWSDVSTTLGVDNTKSVIEFTARTAMNGYGIRCIVSNPLKDLISDEAKVIIYADPKIISHPESSDVAFGLRHTFSVIASGDAIQYQWMEKALTALEWSVSSREGANTDTLYVLGDDSTDRMQFQCIVSNVFSTVVSNPATLILVKTPVINTHPQNVSITVGSSAVFAVNITGRSLNIRWQVRPNAESEWTDYDGEDSTYYRIKFNAIAELNGYQYRCVISNIAGTVYSNHATLYIISTSFAIADSSDGLYENILPVGEYVFSLNASKEGIFYSLGFGVDGDTMWVCENESNPVVFYSDGKRSLRILILVSGNVNVRGATIAPMLESGEMAHGWISPVQRDHDIANDFNYGWFSIGNQYGNVENVTTASMPCDVTIKYRPIWKDTI